eukprot:CAMPEP_0116057666 /NCGR_PEP_ID=MMETSP0322-20121206/4744_1 /TAXON_ID=163516 /ORGANISM="Leptocylindrus danicus var. apora, Strain B651" /LENGTH=137 /DNA_ID=CAMNT_0003541715 /DNA_START=555 /DNA_END=968 /DNA_ORIENTATION=-
MPPSLIPHFSKLLNYLYDDAFVLSSENVVCLIMFSLIFEMPKLEISVNEFIAKYVNPNNATTYLMCIIELQQEDPNGNGQYNAAIEECQEILVFNIKRMARAGNKHAQCALGYMYSKSTCVTKDRKKSVHWYRKAAE